MLIETTKGMLDESLLEKREKSEDIPCGTSVETEYFLDGELVRRDVMIQALPGLISDSLAGSLAAESAKPSVRDFITQQYKQLLHDFADQIGIEVREAYPELSGMAISFNLPGFRLDIKPETGNEEDSNGDHPGDSQ